MSGVPGLSKSSIEYGVKNGHPPLAKNVLCIDFDGTLYSWGSDEIYPDAREVMIDLKNRGYTLVIFTSRLSPRWITAEHTSYLTQLKNIKRVLHRDNVPYDDITSEKIPALLYLDDRALRFQNNWAEVSEQIKEIVGY